MTRLWTRLARRVRHPTKERFVQVANMTLLVYNAFMRRGYRETFTIRWVLLFLATLVWLGSTVVLPARGENPSLRYGTSVSGELGIRRTAELGFEWVRIYYPEQVNAAERHGLKALLLLGWESALPDLETWGDQVQDVVSRYRGRIAAYQICNEPNLAEMWHKPQHAGPGEYVAYLREAYVRAKQADPACLIVTAGMATNGSHSVTALDDLEFIRGMYQAGAKPYFDVLGSHPFGFAYAPEDSLSDPVHCFRRVEQQRAIMVQYGDADKPVWATEFGWIIDPGEGCCNYGDWPSRWWQRVFPQTQSDYLVRAYRYARRNWPWMGVMFVWNMDFSTATWNAYCDQKSWYALLDHNGTPRPAYGDLARMIQADIAPGTCGSGIIVGRVLLQGRDDHRGISISTSGRSVTTGADGSFRIEGVPSGPNTLIAQMPGYLRHRLPDIAIHDGQPVSIRDIQLQAGDVNGDGSIDLFDLIVISRQYGKQQVPDGTPEDINGDGQIDLIDLVLMSMNYGSS